MRVADHAAVSETVEVARKVAGESKASYVNAVLRKIAAMPKEFDDFNSLPDDVKEQAMYCLKQALIACHVRGAFTMEETEAVSKSLRVINS